MFTIRADDKLLYDPKVEELAITYAVLNQEYNEASNFEFTLYPDHPFYDKVDKLNTHIEVYKGARRIFGGRVLNDELKLDKAKTFTCESELAYLCDSIVRPYEWHEDVVRDYAQFMIDQHNDQVDESRQFILRDVTIQNNTDYLHRASIQYPTTFSELKSKLVNSLGGYMFVEKGQDGKLYLDLLEDSPYMTRQTIRLGENMLDLVRNIKGEDVATVIIPLGARLEDDDGMETEERLTIKDVNDDLDYLVDEDAVAKFGWIAKVTDHEGITLPLNLLQAGKKDLAKAVNPIASIDITAIDLKQAGQDIDNFNFLEYVKIESDAHKIVGTLLIIKMTTDLLNPANNKITVGSSFGTFTQKTITIGDRMDALESTSVRKESIININDAIVTLFASIVQTENNIMSIVEAQYVTQLDHETAIQTIGTELEQTRDSFTFTFNNLLQQITDFGDFTQTEFMEIVKYIRFENGNIILGQLGNELMLRISNNRISFLQSGAEVAYINDNRLYITDAEVLRQLTLGNFAFIPRSNGNLSFRKVR